MKQKITSIGTILAGLLLAFGPQFLFQPCPATEKVMRCFWSCQALLVVGSVAALTGLLLLFVKGSEARRMLNVVAFALFVGVILIPTVVIGGCAKSEMACQLITFPVTNCLSVAGLVLQAVSFLGKERT